MSEAAPKPTPWSDALIDHLGAVIRRDPGARAALRSGLRREPVECQRLHRYVARFVPDQAIGSSRERAVYTVAAIAGLWPELATERSDRTLAAALGGLDDKSGWADRRLQQLCRSGPDELHDRLVSTVTNLRSRNAPFDLSRLARDITRWGRSRDRIVREWVMGFDAARYRNELDDTNTGGEPNVR